VRAVGVNGDAEAKVCTNEVVERGAMSSAGDQDMQAIRICLSATGQAGKPSVNT